MIARYGCYFQSSVRRERSWIFRGIHPPPRQLVRSSRKLSERRVEVTKPPKPSRQRAARRSGDQAGRNASERRAGLETSNVGADPALTPEHYPHLFRYFAIR